MIEFSTLQFIYFFGLPYAIFSGFIISFIFAIYRWYKCVTEYILTGDLEEWDRSIFFGTNNWFYGSHTDYNYENNPWAVALDLLLIAIGTTLLSLAWPITIIVFSTITYAKVARVRYRRKKEFMDRLAGEHA